MQITPITGSILHAETHLRAADTAMYRAKKRGKGGLSIGE